MTYATKHIFDATDGAVKTYNDHTETVLRQVCDTAQLFLEAGQVNPLESATLAVHLYVQSLYLVISEIKKDAGMKPDKEQFLAAVRDAVERMKDATVVEHTEQTDET
jgi:hypothetical protein